MGFPRASALGGPRAKPPGKNKTMCRNIKPLFNFDPPATEEEIRAASLQFIRKISGFVKPSRANQAAFDAAVGDVTRVAQDLLKALHTDAPAHNREVWIAKKREKSRARYAAMNAAQAPRK